MSSKHKAKHLPYCLNCHYPLAEFDKMCSQCGQKPTDGKTTMHDLLHEFIHTLFHLDGKFFWTLKHVFIPGRLSLEFFKGHHKRYAHPVQLFLVLGVFTFGLLTSVSKNKESEKRKFDSEEKIFRKQIFFELDSLKNTLPLYKREEGRKAIDSLLVKGYGENNNKNYNLAVLTGWANKRSKIDSLNRVLKANIKDSLNLVATQDTEKLNELNEKIKDLREELADKKEDIMVDSTMAMDVIKKLNNVELDFLPKGTVKFNVKLDSNDLQEIINDLKNSSKPQNRLFSQDSINIGFANLFRNNDLYMVSEIDMYRLSEKELIEKYKVKGVWNLINFRQSLKFRKSGEENIKSFYFSKLIWFTALAILPMAAFYMLLYRRQKRFYVEHFVFLLHYTIMIFGLLSYYFLLKLAHLDKLADTYGSFLNLYLFIVAMPIAMKNFYQQSWGKTIAKFLIAGFVFIIVAIIVVVLASLVVFTLF